MDLSCPGLTPQVGFTRLAAPLPRFRRTFHHRMNLRGATASRHRRYPPARCSCRVVAAIAGRLPHGMGVARLTDMPAEWSRQHQMLGLPPTGIRTESLL